MEKNKFNEMEKGLGTNQGFIKFSMSCQKVIDSYDNEWITDSIVGSDGQVINLEFEDLGDTNNNIPDHINNFVNFMKEHGFNSNGVIHLEYVDCGGLIYEKITINNSKVETKVLHSLDIWEHIK